jgi:hypothetical protein
MQAKHGITDLRGTSSAGILDHFFVRNAWRRVPGVG